ncbi:MAG: hypothetical protein ACKORG_04940 [Actinomycetota bacterium]|jgi:hypothetical protein
MLLNIAIGLLVAGVVLLVLRLLLRTALGLGKFLVIVGVLLIVAAAVLGLIHPFSS